MLYRAGLLYKSCVVIYAAETNSLIRNPNFSFIGICVYIYINIFIFIYSVLYVYIYTYIVTSKKTHNYISLTTILEFDVTKFVEWLLYAPEFKITYTYDMNNNMNMCLSISYTARITKCHLFYRYFSSVSKTSLGLCP